MMKSLAILAATLAAAQASQDAGPGLGRLLRGTDQSISDERQEDCTEENCGRRLQGANTSNVAKKWIKLMDTDEDGKIDGNEFFDFFDKNSDNPYESEPLFRILDFDGDYEINSREIEIGLDEIKSLPQ